MRSTETIDRFLKHRKVACYVENVASVEERSGTVNQKPFKCVKVAIDHAGLLIMEVILGQTRVVEGTASQAPRTDHDSINGAT